MNKQMLLGMVAGIGVATAGGVLGYQFFGQPKANEQGTPTNCTMTNAPISAV